MTDKRQQRFSVYGLAFDADAVLLVRINNGVEYENGCWFLPGGGIEHGEDPHTALRRELYEETGLRIEVGPLLSIGSDHRPLPTGRHTTVDFHLLYLVHAITVTGGTLRSEPGGDTAGPSWVPLDRLPHEPVLPLAALALNTALDRDDIPGAPRPDGSLPRADRISRMRHMPTMDYLDCPPWIR